MKFSTEVTSSSIQSDQQLFFRTQKAYEIASDLVFGTVLEIGNGEGYGIDILKDKCTVIYALDKAHYQCKTASNVKKITKKIPPFTNIENIFFDVVVTFQVIEHIKNDSYFLKEIHRGLKTGGTLLLTTPNKTHTVVRTLGTTESIIILKLIR